MMKTPLKIKVFAWYLHLGVILIKDNLAKRNWHGSKTCVFQHDETKQHLFFQYKFVRSTCLVIKIGSTFYPPRSIENIFGNWFNDLNSRFKLLIRVKVITIRSLWLCKNDKVWSVKIFLLCMSSAGAQLHSVRSRLYNVTCL
jgi:hypothetical protein